MGDFIVIAVLLIITVFIIRSAVKKHKKGGSCAGCSKCVNCNGNCNMNG